MTRSISEAGSFRRQSDGVSWIVDGCTKQGWQSHGGPTAKHPCRALPSTLEIIVPDYASRRLTGVSLYGAFALFAGPECEPSGVVGASIVFLKEDNVLLTKDLIQGRHYTDAKNLQPLYRMNGDATQIETVATIDSSEGKLRIDRLTIEVPGGIDPDKIVFRDLNSPASFVIFDVYFEFTDPATCPFKGQDGHVALNEVGAILRMRDRHRLDEAIHQLCVGLRDCESDIDEARGLGLTFLAAIITATLEMGGPRTAHKALLESARQLERADDIDAIVSSSVEIIRSLTDDLVGRNSVVDDPLIDQAIKFVTRNFTRNINDEEVARELHLSTSHFRHLFRQSTKQPFHRYMVTLRLEKSRELLLQSDLPVANIAESVGFQSPAHFSRAFVKRFGVAPSAIRETRR